MPIQPCELTLRTACISALTIRRRCSLAQAYRGSRVYRGQTPGDNFTVDGVSYYFSADSAGVLRLDSYSVITTELATQSFLRGIKLGDGLQSVLDTIPTADWQPEELIPSFSTERISQRRPGSAGLEQLDLPPQLLHPDHQVRCGFCQHQVRS